MIARFAFVSLAALMASQGWAQTPGANPMSRAELRQCLQLHAALERDKDALAKARAQQDATIQSLVADEAELKASQAQLDRANVKAVKDFNAQVKAHRARVAAHNRTLPKFNAQAAAFDASEARYRTLCAGRTYREADRAAVQPNQP